MKIFHPTYTTPDGQSLKSPRRWLSFYWKRRRCRLPGFTSISQTNAFAKRIEEPMGTFTSGETPDASLVRWLQSQPPKMQARMMRYGLLDGRFAGAGKPLITHLDEWRAVLAKDNTGKHANRYISDAKRILNTTKAVYLSDLTSSRVVTALEAMCKP